MTHFIDLRDCSKEGVLRLAIGSALSTFAVACTPHEQIHPRLGGDRHPIEPSATISISQDFSRHPSTRKNFVPERVFGTVDGDGGPALGKILDADLNERMIAVLDGFANSVRIFDRNGESMPDIGSKGHGPGEFSAVRALGLNDADEVVVFEATGRISIFRPQEPLPEIVQFPGEIQDGCLMGEDLIVHGFVPGRKGFLHWMSREQGDVFSWGSGYSHGNRIVRMYLSSGRVVCLPQSNTVVFMPAMLPELQAYDGEGRLIWWVSLQGFAAQDVVELPRGAKLQMRCEGFHTNERIVPLPYVSDTAVLLQVALVSPVCRTRPSAAIATQSYVVDAADGRVLARASGYPLLHAFHGRVGLGDADTEYPAMATLSPLQELQYLDSHTMEFAR